VQNNIIDGFRIINSVTEIQFPQTTNNTMRNGYVEFERGVGSQWKNDGALTVANGAYKNVYEDIYLKDCVMQARDWNDGLPGDVADSGNDNVFRRIVVSWSIRLCICFLNVLIRLTEGSSSGNWPPKTSMWPPVVLTTTIFTKSARETIFASFSMGNGRRETSFTTVPFRM
jgi:hypothetical protein